MGKRSYYRAHRSGERTTKRFETRLVISVESALLQLFGIERTQSLSQAAPFSRELVLLALHHLSQNTSVDEVAEIIERSQHNTALDVICLS